MSTGGLLSQLVLAAIFIAAALLCYWIGRALWAEIGPMVRLLFRLPKSGSDPDLSG